MDKAAAADNANVNLDDWDPMGEAFNSALNTLALDPEDPITALTGKMKPVSSKIGNVIICEHYAKYGECADGEYCDRIHINPKTRDRIWDMQNSCEENRNRICLNVYYLSSQDYEPNPDVSLLISITHSTSPTNFYFVAPYEKLNIGNYSQTDIEFYIKHIPFNSDVKRKLQRCNEQLKGLLEHDYRSDNINDTIYPTQIVACKQTDRYRRAMVLEVPDNTDNDPNSTYKLFLLDFGSEIFVRREEIYDIKAQCLSEPPLAVHCKLGIKPCAGTGGWSPEIRKYFNEITKREKYLLCKILDYNQSESIYIVDLYNLKTRKSLTQHMVQKGQAERV